MREIFRTSVDDTLALIEGQIRVIEALKMNVRVSSFAMLVCMSGSFLECKLTPANRASSSRADMQGGKQHPLGI